MASNSRSRCLRMGDGSRMSSRRYCHERVEVAGGEDGGVGEGLDDDARRPHRRQRPLLHRPQVLVLPAGGPQGQLLERPHLPVDLDEADEVTAGADGDVADGHGGGVPPGERFRPREGQELGGRHPQSHVEAGHVGRRGRYPTQQHSDEGGEGPGPVGDGRLLLEGHLRERAPVAVVGDEDGVVAEPAVAPGLGRRCGPRPRRRRRPPARRARPPGPRCGTGPGRPRRPRRPAPPAAWPRCRRRWRPPPRSGPRTRPGARRGRRPPGRCRRPPPARPPPPPPPAP